MKKLGLLVKETSQNTLQQSIKVSASGFIIKNSGIASPDLSNLRQSLKNTNAKLVMVKNSVAVRALKECHLEDFLSAVEGCLGFVFVKDEPIAASKVLYSFAKEHEKFVLVSGWLKEKILNKADIESLAKLPSREILLSMLVSTLNAPIAGFVSALKQTIAKLVYCLDAVKNKKENQSHT